MERWFAVHTHARSEVQAVRHLRNQNFLVYLPVYGRRRSHARKVETVRAPFFPRYLFIRLDPETARWRAINSTVGVSGLVQAGGVPSPLPDAVIEALQAREDVHGLICPETEPDFAKGACVRVLDGPLADLVGLFDMGDEQRVILLLSLLGRPVRVELPRTAVAAA